MTTWLTTYSWSAPFDMQEILIDFSSKGTIVSPVGYFQDLKGRKLLKSDPLYTVVYALLEGDSSRILGPDEGKISLASKIVLESLQLMNVRYLVFHRDYAIVYHGYPPVDTITLENNLKATKGVSFLKSFGDLDIYEVAGFYPRFYAVSGNGSHLDAPLVGFQRISPVEYRVRVNNVDKPFNLVFSENFSSDWRLDGRGPQGSLARGFGNVWQLGKTGDYEMRLYYRPQRLLEVGSLISILNLVGGVLVLIFKKK